MICPHRGRDPRQRLLPAREGHREVLRASPAAQHGRPGQEEGHAHQGRHVTNVGRFLSLSIRTLQHYDKHAFKQFVSAFRTLI